MWEGRRNNMNESDILRALSLDCREHKKLFFAHVKDGSYYARQQRILDGFAAEFDRLQILEAEGHA